MDLALARKILGVDQVVKMDYTVLMSKILLFSDLHVHMHKNQLSRLDDCLKALDWVFQTAKKLGINNIIFAGDLFQDRQKIHIISYEKTFRLIRQHCTDNPSLSLYLLVGNHDMWYNEKWDVSSISPLAAIKNIKVIDTPCSYDINNGFVVDFLPYTKNPVEDIKTHFKKKNEVLISHCSVDGAVLNSLYNTKAEISVEYEGDMVKVDSKVFAGWKKVFLGHYHCAQKLNDTVEYIGSPLELNFGEAFQQKHIIVLDTDTFETEYIINDFSPKHLIIKESEIDKFNLSGNFVQVIVEDITSTDIIDMKKTVKDKKFATIEFKEKARKKDEKVLSEEEKKDIKEKLDIGGSKHLEDWLKARHIHVEENSLEVDKLLAIGQDIVRRA